MITWGVEEESHRKCSALLVQIYEGLDDTSMLVILILVIWLRWYLPGFPNLSLLFFLFSYSLEATYLNTAQLI